DYAPIPRYWDLQARAGLALGDGESIELAGLTSHDRFARGVPNPDPALATRDERAIGFYRLSLHYRSTSAEGHVTRVIPWFGYDEQSRLLRYGAVEASDASETARFGLRALHRHRMTDWLDLEAG